MLGFVLFGAPGGVRIFFTRFARTLRILSHSRLKIPRCRKGFLVRLEEFESPTFGSVDQRSIQLSYKRIYDVFSTRGRTNEINYSISYSFVNKKNYFHQKNKSKNANPCFVFVGYLNLIPGVSSLRFIISFCFEFVFFDCP